MFFFFAGGVNQQVREVLKTGVGRCLNCGSRADLVESDKLLKIFFVPVWRWPGKEPALYCGNCKLFFPPTLSHSQPPSTAAVELLKCRSCDRAVEPSFSFCPYCGVAL